MGSKITNDGNSVSPKLKPDFTGGDDNKAGGVRRTVEDSEFGYQTCGYPIREQSCKVQLQLNRNAAAE
jgi:hypothetical protein